MPLSIFFIGGAFLKFLMLPGYSNNLTCHNLQNRISSIKSFFQCYGFHDISSYNYSFNNPFLFFAFVIKPKRTILSVSSIIISSKSVIFQIFQNPLNQRLDLDKIMCCRFPHHPQINSEISMDDLVSHASHISSWDLGISFLYKRGNVFCSFKKSPHSLYITSFRFCFPIPGFNALFITKSTFTPMSPLRHLNVEFTFLLRNWFLCTLEILPHKMAWIDAIDKEDSGGKRCHFFAF